jgi:hypothetical protein
MRGPVGNPGMVGLRGQAWYFLLYSLPVIGLQCLWGMQLGVVKNVAY